MLIVKALIVLACVNGVARRDFIIERLVAAEAALERADYEGARDKLVGVPHGDVALRLRQIDIDALLILRDPQPDDEKIHAWIEQHFRDRAKAFPKDVRFKAWRAEAQLAEGNTKGALATITELKTKDLMPDAFAWLVLAKLSSGEARDAALAICKKRTKVKTICVLPSQS
jgi:hypothetical protein